jgi:hypothetical protein
MASTVEQVEKQEALLHKKQLPLSTLSSVLEDEFKLISAIVAA